MRIVSLTAIQRQELWASLAQMPAFLQRAFGSLTLEEARSRGPAAAFSPLEHVWHLADLETEGFGIRIQRLKTESAPLLSDFDGTKAAQERNYQSMSLVAGLTAFHQARLVNIAALQALSSADWSRSGTQQGVGVVALCDIPVFIFQHDLTHQAEIDQWLHYIGISH